MAAVYQEKGRTPPESILPSECLTLPFVCQERVKKILTQVEIMREKKSWFKTRTPEELNSILPQIHENSQEFMDSLRSFKEKNHSWWEAWCVFSNLYIRDATPKETGGWEEAYKTALKTGRKTAWSAVWLKTESVVREGAWAKDALNWNWRKAIDKAKEAVLMVPWEVFFGATWDADKKAAWHANWISAWVPNFIAARAAAYETIKDLPGFEKNPYIPLFNLFYQGAARMSFRQVDGAEEFVVDFPLIVDRRWILGCLALGDGETGDTEVLFAHQLEEDCSRAIPIRHRRAIS